MVVELGWWKISHINVVGVVAEAVLDPGHIHGQGLAPGPDHLVPAQSRSQSPALVHGLHALDRFQSRSPSRNRNQSPNLVPAAVLAIVIVASRDLRAEARVWRKASQHQGRLTKSRKAMSKGHQRKIPNKMNEVCAFHRFLTVNDWQWMKGKVFLSFILIHKFDTLT